MVNDYNNLIASITHFFPNQVKVYDLSSLIVAVSDNSPTLLHKHFKDPLSKNKMDILVWEIALFLNDQDQSTVYSFFHRSIENKSSQIEWFLSSARLNKSKNGLPKEVVIFSYELQLLDDIKKKLYRILENDAFFKEHFKKVSSLTKKEKEIIQLLASGMSSSEIAIASYTSVYTVNTHRRNINQKLAIQNIAGLLRYADAFDFDIAL